MFERGGNIGYVMCVRKGDTSPVKVIRIFSRLNIGGPSLHVTLLSQELDSKYVTTLITGKIGEGEGDMSYLLETDGRYRHLFVSALGRDIHAWKDIIALWKIWKILRREKPLIIHTHTSKAGVLGRLAALLAGVPIRVHTFHGHMFYGYHGRMISWGIRSVERLLARVTTHVIVISEKQKQDVVNRFWIVPDSKVSVVPLGFDLSPFSAIREDRDTLKNQWHIPLNSLCVGMIGRMVPIKNHEMFLKVAKKIIARRKDVHFVLVGDGSSRDKIYERVLEFNLQRHVSFLGWQKKLASIYPVLDVVCLTSLNEGTPVSLIEAQACGIPVVATDVGGISDVIFHGKNGYLLSSEDVVAFAEKIMSLLDDPSLREKMASFGKKYVFNKFGKQRLLMDMDQLYQRLLREKRL